MAPDPILTLDGRPTVRVERYYPHPIERVWEAVTTPEHLGQWFPSPVEVDLRPGGEMRFGAFAGDPPPPARSRWSSPPRRLPFRWGSDRLTFELTPTRDGTTFALTHAFDDRCGAPSFATGWEICLGGLRSVLAGDPLPAPSRGDRPPRGARARVRPRPARGHRADDGWTVRIERQLTCPAEVAWDLWFGKV